MWAGAERLLATGHDLVTLECLGPLMLSSSYLRSPSHPLRAPRRARGTDIATELRDLVRSVEPAVVFSSLAHLCVPAFSDVCTIDIVEQGELAYRIAYYRSGLDPADTWTGTVSNWSVSTPFAGAHAGDTHADGGYAGVMTNRWWSRPPSSTDRARAVILARHAVATVSEERGVGDDGRHRSRTPR